MLERVLPMVSKLLNYSSFIFGIRTVDQIVPFCCPVNSVKMTVFSSIGLEM